MDEMQHHEPASSLDNMCKNNYKYEEIGLDHLVMILFTHLFLMVVN